MIRRYKKVLKAYNQGLKLSASCAYAGVNELTVRSTASIAELATASPAEFTKLLDKTKQGKLKDVANLCENYIKGDAQVQTKIDDLKSQCKLIPYAKRASLLFFYPFVLFFSSVVKKYCLSLTLSFPHFLVLCLTVFLSFSHALVEPLSLSLFI